jgi:hypothetical protein
MQKSSKPVRFGTFFMMYLLLAHTIGLNGFACDFLDEIQDGFAAFAYDSNRFCSEEHDQEEGYDDKDPAP